MSKHSAMLTPEDLIVIARGIVTPLKTGIKSCLPTLTLEEKREVACEVLAMLQLIIGKQHKGSAATRAQMKSIPTILRPDKEQT